MKYSKRSTVFTVLPIILMALWVIFRKCCIDNLDSQKYITYFLFVEFLTMIFGFYFAVKSLKEESSIFKKIGITLSLFYLVVFLFLIISNIFDVYNAFQPK